MFVRARVRVRVRACVRVRVRACVRVCVCVYVCTCAQDPQKVKRGSPPLTVEQCMAFAKTFDADGNGVIDKSEFHWLVEFIVVRSPSLYARAHARARALSLKLQISFVFLLSYN